MGRGRIQIGADRQEARAARAPMYGILCKPRVREIERGKRSEIKEGVRGEESGVGREAGRDSNHGMRVGSNIPHLELQKILDLLDVLTLHQDMCVVD